MCEWLVACWFVVIIVLVCYFILFWFILFFRKNQGIAKLVVCRSQIPAKKTESNPSLGGSQLILRGCYILFFGFP